jgi:hypothetical protein
VFPLTMSWSASGRRWRCLNRLWAAASKCELCFFRTQIHSYLETIARMSCGLHYTNPYFWIVICQLTSFDSEADMYALMSNKQITTTRLVLYTNPFPHEHFFSRQRSPGLSSSAAGKLFVVETCLRSYEGVNSSIPLFFANLGDDVSNHLRWDVLTVSFHLKGSKRPVLI